MFGTVFGQTANFIDRRFFLNIVLPSLAFWGGLALLAAQGAGWAVASHWWSNRTGFEQALLVGGAVGGLLLFAFLAAGQVTPLTRLWEGYWPGRAASRLAARRGRSHLRRWGRLDLADSGQYMQRFYGYPVRKADVMPTRLGNVLRAAEDYPGDDERYGMDAVSTGRASTWCCRRTRAPSSRTSARHWTGWCCSRAWPSSSRPPP